MTEKRFKVEYEKDEGVLFWEIIDNNTQNNTSNEKKLCEWLNELAEEKEIAIDGIKIADELIRKYGSDELKHEWKKEVTVKYR